MKQDELIKKCEGMEDSSVMGACRVMLELMDKEKVKIEDEKDQTYLEMAENLKPCRRIKSAAISIKST